MTFVNHHFFNVLDQGRAGHLPLYSRNVYIFLGLFIDRAGEGTPVPFSFGSSQYLPCV